MSSTPDPIGDWYASKDRECRAALDAVREAEARNATPDEIKRLKRAAEYACYVGD